MNITQTKLPGVLVIEPKVFLDPRGFFLETWNSERYADLSIPRNFVQDNLSKSARGVLRGLHFQNPNPQGKLVYVIEGEIFDVAVDIRIGSPSYGKSESVILSGDNKKQFYVPPGLAHGFCVLSETVIVAYKVTDLYNPKAECSLMWNDPDLAIDWPIDHPILSSKDKEAPCLKDIPPNRLLKY
ncbi:MAG: dTDP-4-dehydrorhamnose 3,5-epimerase [Deltaproteobacteria bacterium]|nr:dTDP-4-dehydrorhamnose 3,5-epimerase [Deltaproteobacteria bacterium]